MPNNKKRHWIWNLLIVITLILVILAFIAHAKNWVTLKEDHVTVLSGIYHKKILFSEMDSIAIVPKIPQMERINGFSAGTTEKGIFKDSITRNSVYVYVDNLENPKIRMKYQDSLTLYLNFTDSLETLKMYELFQTKINMDLQKP